MSSADQHSVEIEAEDMPGLLHRLTAAISCLHWDIHSARINTWGSTARDVFYVTDDKGAKLDTPTASQVLRKTLYRTEGTTTSNFPSDYLKKNKFSR